VPSPPSPLLLLTPSPVERCRTWRLSAGSTALIRLLYVELPYTSTARTYVTFLALSLIPSPFLLPHFIRSLGSLVVSQDFDCGAYGVDCFCKNDKGEVENTNVDAPIMCGTISLDEVCGEQCNGLSFVDVLECDNDTPKCTCAKDDGIEGVGDDASQADRDYADANDEKAKEAAEQLANNPNPAPPTMLENGTIVPSIADAVDVALAPQSTPPPSSGVAIGGSILAMAAAIVLA
jgi:hypothetical protein